MPEPPPSPAGDDFSQRLDDAMGGTGGGAQSADQPAESAQQQQESAQTQQTQDQSSGPVGSGDHVIRDGECLSSIAKDTGHFWQTIWDDSANADVKQARQNPNVLLPGDRLAIPELRPKEEACETEQLHRFRRRGEPAMLRLRIVRQPEREEETEETQQPSGGGSDPNTCDSGDPTQETQPREDEPRANVPYRLEVDSEVHTGSTDEDGRIEAPIPGNARRGRLILNPGTEDEETVVLQLGHINPIDTISGVKQRLSNLTFDAGNIDEEETPELERALLGFQRKHGLDETGRVDQATKDKLLEVHGC